MLEYLYRVFDDTLSRIEEFALPNYKIKERVHNLAHELFYHILKIAYLYENYPQTVEHWSREVANWIIQCFKEKLKSTNKFPTQSQIELWLFEACTDKDELDFEYNSFKIDYDFVIDKEKTYNYLLTVVPVLLEYYKEDKLSKTSIVDVIIAYKDILK